MGSDTMAIVNTVWPFLLMGVIFYLMIFRPQRKEQKKRTAMLEGLRRGDKVVTIGGICGEISKIHDKHVVLKIADGVEIKLVRSAISYVQDAQTEEKEQ